MRLDGLDAQMTEAARLSHEASAADTAQWEQLEDHRLRLDGLDEKIIESVALADTTRAELSEQISHLKELIFLLEQRDAELQSKVKHLEESSLCFRLKKVFHQMMFWKYSIIMQYYMALRPWGEICLETWREKSLIGKENFFKIVYLNRML